MSGVVLLVVTSLFSRSCCCCVAFLFGGFIQFVEISGACFYKLKFVHWFHLLPVRGSVSFLLVPFIVRCLCLLSGLVFGFIQFVEIAGACFYKLNRNFCHVS